MDVFVLIRCQFCIILYVLHHLGTRSQHPRFLALGQHCPSVQDQYLSSLIPWLVPIQLVPIHLLLGGDNMTIFVEAPQG
ncbi:hypothetical protein SRDD_40760 [Serratia sp. DD3]|nr:hypothetical protein SRDD_40760 [Serratia sp. DD3]